MTTETNLDSAKEEAMREIRAMDKTEAPKSETSLLGDALENIRRCSSIGELEAALDWWRLAYEAVAAWPHPVTYEELQEHGWDADQVLVRAKARAAGDSSLSGTP